MDSTSAQPLCRADHQAVPAAQTMPLLDLPPALHKRLVDLPRAPREQHTHLVPGIAGRKPGIELACEGHVILRKDNSACESLDPGNLTRSSTDSLGVAFDGWARGPIDDSENGITTAPRRLTEPS